MLVGEAKLREYLLNPKHQFGSAKAQFILEFGFTLDEWEALGVALRRRGRDNTVSRSRSTPFGPRYEVDGEIETPDGRRPRIRTVWQNDDGAAPDNRLPFASGFMIKEHDPVVLTESVTDEGLQAGDIGTVVHVHQKGAGFEVEFMTLTGQTIAVVSLLASQVRPVAPRDIAHVREVATV